MEEGWVHVYNVGQRYFAELIKQMLADHNIQAVLLDKKDSAYTTFGEIEIYVREENQLRARNLIKEFEESGSDDNKFDS
jgi:hypothetical protein